MDFENQVMVFDAPSRTFSRELHQVLELSDGEVLVRVRCCTICGSDLHTWQGRRSAPTRCVLGHEIIGDVLTWGGDHPPQDYAGNPIQVGQRITWAMTVSCGDCFYCNSGIGQKCERLFKYGHELAQSSNSTGGLSRYCQLKKNTAIFPVPDSLPDSVATPANCASATVMAAIRSVRQTHNIEDANVLVIGMGMLGLTACTMLREYGSKEVIALDRNHERSSKALAFGATRHAIDECDLNLIIDDATQNRGVDIAFDFAGVAAAVEQAIRHLRIGGCALLAGSVFPTDEIPIQPETIVRRMITLRGLHNYLPSDLEMALQFLEQFHQQYPFETLVEKQFPLVQAADAFEFAEKEKPIRVSVVRG